MTSYLLFTSKAVFAPCLPIFNTSQSPVLGLFLHYHQLDEILSLSDPSALETQRALLSSSSMKVICVPWRIFCLLLDQPDINLLQQSKNTPFYSIFLFKNTNIRPGNQAVPWRTKYNKMSVNKRFHLVFIFMSLLTAIYNINVQRCE